MEYKFNVNANEYLPLREVVFNNLRDAILKGDLKPGERLLENQLADKLGVSRTPVREALRMLEQENLVLLIPRKGAQVLSISAEDIKNIMEIRSSLEVLAMKHACKNMSPEKIQELKRLNVMFEEAFEKAAELHDYQEVADIDVQFHNIIIESANNDMLCLLINNIRTRAYRYRMAYLEIHETKQAVINHHRKIVAAIENHTEEQGVKIMAEHIEHQMLEILKSLKK